MRRFASAGWATTSTPSTRTRPLVGRTSVVMQPRVVLLPAPFGPRRPKNPPRSTVKEIPRTASTGGVFRRPGYVLTRFSTTRAAANRLLSARAASVADDHAAALDHGADGGNAHADEVEEPARAQQHEVGPLAGLEAPDLAVEVEGVCRIHGRRGQRLLERKPHREAAD